MYLFKIKKNWNIKRKGYWLQMYFCGVGKNKAVNILNNSVLEDQGVIIINNYVSEGRDVL